MTLRATRSAAAWKRYMAACVEPSGRSQPLEIDLIPLKQSYSDCSAPDVNLNQNSTADVIFEVRDIPHGYLQNSQSIDVSMIVEEESCSERSQNCRRSRR